MRLTKEKKEFLDEFIKRPECKDIKEKIEKMQEEARVLCKEFFRKRNEKRT